MNPLARSACVQNHEGIYVTVGLVYSIYTDIGGSDEVTVDPASNYRGMLGVGNSNRDVCPGTSVDKGKNAGEG